MSDRILASKHGVMDGGNNYLSFKRRRSLCSPPLLLLNTLLSETLSSSPDSKTQRSTFKRRRFLLTQAGKKEGVCDGESDCRAE